MSAAALVVGASLASATPAAAKKPVDENYLPFKNCPIAVKKLEACVVATTTSGEFKLGSKTVKIETPVTLQGGLLPPPKSEPEIDRELIPPTDGAPLLEAAPMKVPGGLTGIEGLGEEVTATTELVGPVIINEANQVEEKGIAVKLPLRVKLNNAALGEECFVGSAAEPVLLELTTGATSPPSPNTPIHGSKGTLAAFDNIAEFSGLTLVDNSFSAPGAAGCGGVLATILDPIVDADSGLPSAAGNNTAILNGSVQEGFTRFVKKSHVIAKTKKK
ncbi:MAG TPA: hypothetical protein VGG08_04220 [Solirubrobacteraceae bacterium]|jgi:hypothetical protein